MLEFVDIRPLGWRVEAGWGVFVLFRRNVASGHFVYG